MIRCVLYCVGDVEYWLCRGNGEMRLVDFHQMDLSANENRRNFIKTIKLILDDI